MVTLLHRSTKKSVLHVRYIFSNVFFHLQKTENNRKNQQNFLSRNFSAWLLKSRNFCHFLALFSGSFGSPFPRSDTPGMLQTYFVQNAIYMYHLGAMSSKYVRKLHLETAKRYSIDTKKLWRKGPVTVRSYKIFITMQKKILVRRFFRFLRFLQFDTQ